MTSVQKRPDARNLPIPGYTGHIPLRFCSIGSSYGGDAVVYLSVFRSATQRRRGARDELWRRAATTPQLPPICCNEDVLQVLHDYNYKHHPNRLGTVLIERDLLDPPLPGWTGFVPRAKVTELGHGVRYRVMAKNCFQDFKNLINRVPYDSSISAQRGEMCDTGVCKVPHTYQRFYRPEGMMPKYTGHIPHKHLIAGKTFGNLCRSSSVCTHTEDSYGAYLTKKRKALLKHQQATNVKDARNYLPHYSYAPNPKQRRLWDWYEKPQQCYRLETHVLQMSFDPTWPGATEQPNLFRILKQSKRIGEIPQIYRAVLGDFSVLHYINLPRALLAYSPAFK